MGPQPGWLPDGRGKHALVERKRRFLFATVPERASIRTVEIVDRYLDDGRLRLRCETTAAAEGSGRIDYKLTQKLPAPCDTPGLITTV